MKFYFLHIYIPKVLHSFVKVTSWFNLQKFFIYWQKLKMFYKARGIRLFAKGFFFTYENELSWFSFCC